MPYIKKDRRKVFAAAITDIMEKGIGSAGELNYLVSMFCKIYGRSKKFNYQVINDIIGALEGAKHEYVRRVVNGYEDGKIQENGDI